MFEGTRGPHNARCIVIGEAFGEQERQKGVPFVGPSGVLLEEMLREAGIDPRSCLFANCVARKPYGNDMRTFLVPTKESGGEWINGVHCGPILAAGLQRLDELISYVQPELIISCGNWPTWWLTGKLNAETDKGFKIPTGIDTWRGSQLFTTASRFGRESGIPVLPILHPASILRMYKNKVMCVQDLRRGAGLLRKLRGWTDTTKRNFILRPTAAEVEEWIEDVMLSPDTPIINDLETYKQRIHIMGLADSKYNGIVIPFFETFKDGRTIPCYSPQDFERIFLALYKLFSNPSMSFVGQNWQYDIQYIHEYFFCLPRVEWDTMVAQHIMFVRLRKSLEVLASMYCEHYVYWKAERKESIANEDLDQALRYNAEDLWRTAEIYEGQKVAMATLGCEPQFRKRLKLFRAAVNMSNRGLPVDDALRQKQKMELVNYAMWLQGFLEEVVPDWGLPASKSDVPWYRSPQQKAAFLYDCLGLREIRSKTGGRTTNKEALVELGYRYPYLIPLFSALIVLNSIGVIAGNFLSAPLGPDKRMRCTFTVAGPITNRLASYESSFGDGTNLQNMMRPRGPMDMLDQDLA